MNGTRQYKQQGYQDHKRTEIQNDFCFFNVLLLLLFLLKKYICLLLCLFYMCSWVEDDIFCQ